MKSIIIEGIDRLGKNTLITGIQNQLGFFQDVHYQKPELLDVYLKQARASLFLPDDMVSPKIKSTAQKYYQVASFTNMFRLLSSEVRFIMNRAHLGEFVYAPRYRDYSGDYIFELERNMTTFDPANFSNSTLLVLLHTSSFDFIKDDGLSLDFTKKEEEQMDFIRAFEKSKIKHKLMLDVNDSRGNFVPAEKLLKVVLQAYQELDSMKYQIMNTSWYYDEAGNLNRNNLLQPDPNKIVN
jgi:hypothetical protein